MSTDTECADVIRWPPGNGDVGEGDVDDDRSPLHEKTPEQSRSRFDTTSTCIIVLTVLAVLYTAYFAAPVIFPIVLAVLIGLPLRSPVRWLRKFHVPDFVGACIVLAIMCSLLVAALVMIAKPAAKWIDDAPQNLERVERKLRHMGSSTIADVKDASKKVDEMTKSAADPGTVQVELKQPSWTNKALNATTSMVVGSIICLSLVFLFLAFGEEFFGSFVNVFSRRYDQQKVSHMLLCIERMISNYLFSYGAINVGLGIIIGLGLWWMGMPNPVLWGVMAGCLNFIPLVGLVTGTAVVTLVAILSFDSLVYAMLAPTIYLVVNGIECNIVTPAILGRSLKLSVVMILVFVILWGWIWGVGGALIAVPLLASLKIVCDHFESLAPLGTILSGKTPLTPQS